ncbi:MULTISPECIES: hypothetical protein [Bacillaceae]|uniref:Uncharacterized protein n=1 Tax=Evansella alkalicola TaxID=745819 RepID=A0ABS6JS72_9BACI|nr:MULTISPECIES: hypothetical protein [Bacillaceae]MBU9721338.1 hypothetical protein [Bacillus alkalicola]
MEISEGKAQVIHLLVTQIQENTSIDCVTKFSLSTYATQLKFNSYVVGISPTDDTVFSKNIDIEKVQYLMTYIVEYLVSNTLSVENFALTKYYLDSLYLLLTDHGALHITYQPSFLLRSSELGEQLGVSRTTIKSMVKNGMETIEQVGYSSFPKHNEFYWKDGIWASRIQSIHQQQKIRNQTKEDLIREIEQDINDFTNRYNGDFHTVFADVLSGIKNKYDLAEPDDFADWKGLLEDLELLKRNS